LVFHPARKLGVAAGLGVCPHVPAIIARTKGQASDIKTVFLCGDMSGCSTLYQYH
jgi:hypothetical protein